MSGKMQVNTGSQKGSSVIYQISSEEPFMVQICSLDLKDQIAVAWHWP